jgi:hypothetical protein
MLEAVKKATFSLLMTKKYQALQYHVFVFYREDVLRIA